VYQAIPAAQEVRPNVALLTALAEARAFGVPQYAVASAAEISPALLSMIARGRARATQAHARAIAKALGREVSELFPTVTGGVA
jgi:transcriptional regulator with XRE-family HTH domain